MLDTLYYGNTIIEWLTALSIIVLAFVVAKALYWVLGRCLKPLLQSTETTFDEAIVDQLQEPIVFMVVITGIRYGLGTLNLPDSVMAWPARAHHFLFALTIAWLVTRLYEATYKKYVLALTLRTETDFDDHILPVLNRGVKFIVWSLGIAVGLNNAGYDVGAILAGLGIGGLAFALAAKDTVANMFGGITVFMNRPFKIGDRIEVAGIDGWVTDLGLRCATITDFFGQCITIPNKVFAEMAVKNIDARPAYYERTVLHLRHDTSADQVELAMTILKEIARKSPLINDTVWVRFQHIGDYSLDIQFWYAIKIWTPEEKDTFADFYHKIDAGKTDVNLAILREFANHDIKLAFPVQAIELRTDSVDHQPVSLFSR